MSDKSEIDVLKADNERLKTERQLSYPYEKTDQYRDQQKKITSLQIQLEQERERHSRYGLVISAALRGDASGYEPLNDGRMQAIRELKAENERLTNELDQIRINGDC